MNRTVKLLVLIVILAGFSRCSRDAMNPVPVVPEGYIRAALDLQVEESDSILTRATPVQEAAYDKSKVWVLLFNATSDTDGTPTTLVQAPVKATELDNKLYVLLRATTRPVTLYVVTGLSDALNNYLATASNFSEEETDFATVNTRLQTAAVTAAGVPIGAGSYFHMSSAPVFYSDGTIPLTSITEPLIRNVAKIDVDASAVTTDFQLKGVTLIDGAQKGFVFRQNAILPNHGGTMQYSEKTAVTGNKIASEIYLYENSGFLSDGSTPNPTTLIVRGEYRGAPGYYRMDILKKNENGTYTPYDIKRNTSYTLIINKVEAGGYLTFDEALAGEPANTAYQVVVNDSNSHDIVSNGHYYLGVSNSEFVVYGEPGQTENLLITTVATDAPAGTYTTITASAGLSATTMGLTTPNGTVTKTDIYASVGSAENHYIDLRVGNLTKRITIRRKASVAHGDSQKTDFIDPKYMFGEVVSGKEWVRLAVGSNADFNLSPVSLTDPAGGIYVRYNSTLPMNASRSAELYVHKANNEGRAKMLLFASPITYIGSTLPANIDKNGKDINEVNLFNATFSNPGGYPFTAGIALSATPGTVLMETAADATAVKSIDLAGVAATGSESLPRGLTLKYKVNGAWLETGRSLQQRTFLKVRILSVGGNAIHINNGSTINYGEQLGPALPGNQHMANLGLMFHFHTGVGKPIENNFELFNLSDGYNSGNGPSRYNNIGQILREKHIDILYCSINYNSFSGNVGPNASQVAEILAWLDENPYRGMIFITDYPDNAEITKALFGVAQVSSGGTDPFSKLPISDPYYNHSVYKAIMCGSYSTLPALHSGNPVDLRETTFMNYPYGGNAYGGVPLARTNAAGFIPIFYVTISGTEYVLFAVHPKKNIVMMGDINWFSSWFTNSTASLNASESGNYPKMIMNMWEWYINSVALGRGE
jgi:hypothetical protein